MTEIADSPMQRRWGGPGCCGCFETGDGDVEPCCCAAACVAEVEYIFWLRDREGEVEGGEVSEVGDCGILGEREGIDACGDCVGGGSGWRRVI